jgi:hypothetical protein
MEVGLERAATTLALTQTGLLMEVIVSESTVILKTAVAH